MECVTTDLRMQLAVAFNLRAGYTCPARAPSRPAVIMRHFGACARPPPPPAPAARPRPRAWRRRHRHRAARSAACAAARVALRLPSSLAATATGGPFHVAMRSSLLFTPTGQTTPKRRERGADRDLVGAKGGRAGGTILGCGLGLPSVRETRSVLTFAVATPEAPTGRQDSTTRQAPETRARHASQRECSENKCITRNRNSP